MHRNRVILLTEDEVFIALSTAETLKANGYSVITAHSGESCLKHITDDEAVDLILMDIDLGRGMDGTETARKILALKHIPIVFLTSHSEQEMVNKVRGITRYGYVIKNSGDFVLLSSIEMAFELFEAYTKTQNSLKLVQETEKKYSTIINGAAEGILIASIENRKFIYANPRICEMLGYSENELLDAEVADIHPGEKLQEILAIFELQSRGKLLTATDVPCLRKDGTIFYADIKTSLVVIDNKPCNVGFFSDNTEQHKAKATLAESEMRYRLLVDNSPYAIGIHQDGIIVFVNKAAVKLFGAHSADELIGTPIRDRVHTDGWNLVLDRMQRLLQGETIIYPKEDKYIRLDGSIVYVEVSAAPFTYRDRPAVQIIALDITGRVRAERGWEAIFNGIPFPIAIMDVNHNIMDINKQFEMRLGRKADEIRNIRCWKIFHGENAICPPDGCPHEKLLLTGIPRTIDMTVEAFGGYFIVYCTPVYDEAGQIEKVIHICVDITDRKISEEKIRTLLSEKEIFIKELQHRIKNNLNSISGLISLQLNASDDKNVINALQETSGRIRILINLYNKLVYDENFCLSLKDYFAALLMDIKAVFLDSTRIKIKQQIADISLNPKILFSMGIILNELITNSLKYAFPDNRQGTITVAAGIVGNQLIIRIEDDGAGMPTTSGSCGFGITLVRSLVEQIGAIMEIDSRAGTKYKFSIIADFQGNRTTK